jgi:hypothetical protein
VWMSQKCFKSSYLDFSSRRFFLILFMHKWTCLLSLLWFFSYSLECSFMAEFHYKVNSLYLMVAISKLHFWSVFSYLFPISEMLFNVFFLCTIIFIDQITYSNPVEMQFSA